MLIARMQLFFSHACIILSFDLNKDKILDKLLIYTRSILDVDGSFTRHVIDLLVILEKLKKNALLRGS